METKVCKLCGMAKDINMFPYHNKKVDDRRRARCTICTNNVKRSRYANNIEKENARGKKYYNSNKDKKLNNYKIWAKQNPEKINSYARKRDRNDIEEMNDTYIIKIIVRNYPEIGRRSVTKDLINIKRKQLKLKRDVRNNN